MTNTKYLKGVRLERKIINLAKANNCIGIRSAGSKGDIDCVIIDPKHNKILFIQAKNNKALSKKEVDKYFYLRDLLFNEFMSEFLIVQDIKQIKDYFNNMSFQSGNKRKEEAKIGSK